MPMPKALDLLNVQTESLSANEERRAAPRHPVGTLRVPSFLADEESARGPAVLRDISTLGIGLLVSRPLALSSLVQIELVNRAGLLIRRMRARVVHTEGSTGEWIVGCAFVSELGND